MSVPSDDVAGVWVVEAQESIWRAWTDAPPMTAKGPSLDVALRALGDQIDSWLDDVTRRRSGSTSAARWWAARADRRGSVVAWVIENARLTQQTTTDDRRLGVETAFANGRIDGLEPSEAQIRDAEDYIAGRGHDR